MRAVFCTFTILLGIAQLDASPVELMAAEVKDAEAATHGDEAASYQVVDTYEFPGFKIM